MARCLILLGLVAAPFISRCNAQACADQDARCPQWASLGYCVGDFSDHMLANCQQSCVYCPGSEHVPPPENTVDEVTCHKAICGRAGRCSPAERCITDPATVVDVRCCSDQNPTEGAWARKSGCSVWGESDRYTDSINQCFSLNYSAAEAFCNSLGSDTRLCTEAELVAGCTAGTGCGFDNVLVWSSTTATVPETAPQLAANQDSGVGYTRPSLQTTTTTEEPSTAAGSSNFEATSDSDDSTDSGTIVGAIFGVIALLLLVALIMVVMQRQRAAHEIAAAAASKQVTHNPTSQFSTAP